MYGKVQPLHESERFLSQVCPIRVKNNSTKQSIGISLSGYPDLADCELSTGGGDPSFLGR